MSEEIVRWECVDAATMRYLAGQADADLFRRTCWTEGIIKIGLSLPGHSDLQYLSVFHNGRESFGEVRRILFFEEPKAPSRAYLMAEDHETVVVYAHHLSVARAIVNVGISLHLADQEYVPVHAAVLELQGVCFVIIGPSKSGKSRVVNRLATEARATNRQFRVLTDDWSLLRFDQHGQLFAISPERFLSLREEGPDGLRDSLISDLTETGFRVGKKRFLYNPNHDQSFRPAGFILLGGNIIPALGGAPGFHVKEKARHAIESCQTFPYILSSLRDRHIQFWEKVFETFPARGFPAQQDGEDLDCETLLCLFRC